MESNGTDALLAGDPLSGPEFDGNGYHADEEVLLIQMMETSNEAEAVSPKLRAVLDDPVDFRWPSGKRQQSPLLMERPRSSGIDSAAFSFARSAQNGKPFSLQPAMRCPYSGTNQDKPDQDRRLEGNNLNEGQNNQAKAAVRSRTQSTQYPTSSHNPESSVTTEQREAQNKRALASTTPNTDARPKSRSTVNCQIGLVPPLGPGPECDQQLLSPEYGTPAVTLASSRTNQHDQSLEQPSSSDQRLDRVPSLDPLDPGQNHLRELRRNTNEWKVVKRRHSDKRRATKQASYVSSDTNLQLPEEVLFRQLFGRLRAREESEAVASNLQKEMEANMISLRDENNVLKTKLELLGSKLQKQTTEARTYKSQTDSWKSKLAKVKLFLNELGVGYQNLRGEAIHFKAIRKSLDKDRKEITESIEDVKARLGQISQASHERRGCLSEAESIIASLGQELKHARERAQYSQDQLADEKKRSRLLELYIQNCSRAQDRKLDLVKANQLEVMKRLETAFETTSKKYESSYSDISDTLERRLDDLLTLVGTNTERLLNDKLDVERHRETICTFESHMDTAIRQLGEDIETHSKISEGMMRSLEEQVQLFEKKVCDRSTLLKQLSASEDRCIQLEAKLEGTVPAFEKLSFSIDDLREREIDLGQRMESLEAKLSEVKLPEQFENGYFHISEKLGLENEVQQLTLMLKLTQEKLEEQQLDSAKKRDELREVIARAHEAERNAAKLELQSANLQEKIEAAEREAKDNIENAIANSQDKCGTEFERRLHKLLIEKTEIEANTKRAKEQLAESQRRLAEAGESARKQRNDLDALFTERQKRIEVLEASRAEQTSNLAKRETEIQKMREQEVVLMTQQSSLRNQLDKANQRSKSLEGELLKNGTESQLSRKTLEDSFSTLQRQFALKEEDCKSLQDRLYSIQNQLVKKEEECQSFLGSLHTIQEDLVESEKGRQALQDSLSSLQDKVAEKEVAHQALQNSLSSVQNRLARKEEEYRELSKELEVANIAQTNLESGKSKARAEIHALLKRVQDSESGMKSAREILHRMKIAQLEQSLPETLDQLERAFQAANSSQPTSGGQPAQVRTLETSARDGISRTKHGVHSLDKLQTNAGADEPKTPVNQFNEHLPLKQARNIVPFSSILQGISPVRCSVADNEPFDLSCMLTQMPERRSTPPEPGALSRPEKDNQVTEISSGEQLPEPGGPLGFGYIGSTQGTNSMSTQEHTYLNVPMEQGHPQPKDSMTARKVAFVTRKLTAETDDLQVPDSQEKNTQNNILESSLNDNPTRTNRWTYSKRQREMSTTQQETMAPETITSQAEDQQMCSKRAKASASSALVTQSRTASEMYDRWKSPTRLASGSSRTSLNVPIADQLGPTKNRRRSGRRTRGNKYNARFGQGA